MFSRDPRRGRYPLLSSIQIFDVVKHYDRDKRAVDLERSLETDLDRSASGMAGWLAADQTQETASGPDQTKEDFNAHHGCPVFRATYIPATYSNGVRIQPPLSIASDACERVVTPLSEELMRR